MTKREARRLQAVSPLKIGFLKYRVSILNKMPPRHRADQGLLDPRKLHVLILRDLEFGDAVETLFHEALHGIFSNIVAMPYLAHDWSSRVTLRAVIEEDVITSLSPAILVLFADNPKLCRLIAEVTRKARK